uniref:Uncharacterized protein n=1 Tax=viral metagenome TaxID=1070528 RepID=A0A6M3LK64_9ZZZZ
MDKNEPTQSLVEEWMCFTTAPIHYTKACDEQFHKRYYPHLRVIFLRMKKKGIVESVGGREGFYRLVDDSARPIEWQDYEAHTDSGLILPFDLRKYVFIYPDTTTIVAGSKSSGKTGFLYRTVVLNMYGKRKVKLLTCMEGGIGQLRDRFSSMDVEIPKPAPFDVIPVYGNFHDYVKEPQTLYIIDYIDAPEGTDFYLIGAQVKKIDQKLQGLDSLAVIGLQKPTGRDTAFGGEQTLKAATLYIALDTGKLKLVDVKVPVNKKLHPKNMQFSFEYEDEGTRFTNIDPFWGV